MCKSKRKDITEKLIDLLRTECPLSSTKENKKIITGKNVKGAQALLTITTYPCVSLLV